MKTLLMSFWPSVFENISNQIKIFEYRRTFPDECKSVYMYISKPIKAICGVVELGNKFTLEDWRKSYINFPDVVERIDSYHNSYKYAMEIISFQELEPISLEELRVNVSGFTAPQSYLILENNENLKNYIHSKTVFIGEKKINNFADVLPAHICLRY